MTRKSTAISFLAISVVLACSAILLGSRLRSYNEVVIPEPIKTFLSTEPPSVVPVTSRSSGIDDFPGTTSVSLKPKVVFNKYGDFLPGSEASEEMRRFREALLDAAEHGSRGTFVEVTIMMTANPLGAAGIKAVKRDDFVGKTADETLNPVFVGYTASDWEPMFGGDKGCLFVSASGIKMLAGEDLSANAFPTVQPDGQPSTFCAVLIFRVPSSVDSFDVYIGTVKTMTVVHD